MRNRVRLLAMGTLMALVLLGAGGWAAQAGLGVEASQLEMEYETVSWLPGYLCIAIPNPLDISLNKFGLKFSPAVNIGEIEDVLAIGGTATAEISGEAFYWAVTLEGEGLAPKGILLLIFKLSEDVKLEDLTLQVSGYKVHL
jgi:hypothetical protein